MASGLGYKEFSTGDVLTAADANGYLASQVVMVFASAAARTSAITSPEEGMVSYLKDTNSTEYYSGSAWVAIGAAGGGGLTLLSTTALSGAATQITIADSSYKHLYVELQDFNMSTANHFGFRINNETAANSHFWAANYFKVGTGNGLNAEAGTYCQLSYYYPASGDSNNFAWFQINNYASSIRKVGNNGANYNGEGVDTIHGTIWGTSNQSPVTRIDIIANAGTWSGGNALVYGVK
jgi:hypothetical protein